jgi:2-methylcitrate dehydratase PrpD
MEKTEAGIIDLTPTWAGVLPALLAVIENGSESGRAAALSELRRMAKAADAAVAVQRAEDANAILWASLGGN